MKNKITLATLFCLAISQSVLAQEQPEQQVRVEVSEQTDGSYRGSVYYQTSDGGGATGLGILLHYDSSSVIIDQNTDNSLSDVYEEDQIGISNELDSSNADGNSATDRLIRTAWAVLSGSWPSSYDEQEVLLYHFDFSLQSEEDPAEIIFNFSVADSAYGYGFSAEDYSAFLPVVIKQAPSGTDESISLLEDSSYAFSVSDFGFSDPDGDSLAAVIIETLPSAGSLEFDGTTLTNGQEIAAGDLSNLAFVPEANENGNSYASFDFRVKDDAELLFDDSENVAAQSNTVTLDVTPVNDPPIANDGEISLFGNSGFAFTENNFAEGELFSDPDDSPSDEIAEFIIESLPDAGELTLNGNPVSAGEVVPVDSFNTGLAFEPAQGEFGSPYATMTFSVRDDGGTDSGGVDRSESAGTITFEVRQVNNAPVGADNTLTLFENSQYVFQEGDFGFSDPNNQPADEFQSVVITGLPGSGSLMLSGNPVSVNDVVPVGQLGDLVFAPEQDGNGDAYAAVSFRVRDDGGEENGGVNGDSEDRTITFNVSDTPPTPPGAGGGGQSESPGSDDVNEVNEELDQITVDPEQGVDEETRQQLDRAVTRSSEVARQVAESLEGEDGDIDTAIDAIRSVSRAGELAGQAARANAPASRESVVDSLSSVSEVISAISRRGDQVTPEQRQAVAEVARSTVRNTAEQLTEDRTPDELVDMVSATSDVLNAAGDAGAGMDEETEQETRSLVNRAVSTGIRSFSQDIDTSDAEAVETLLREDPEALEFAVSTSVALRSRSRPDAENVSTALAERGAPDTAVANLMNALERIANPDGVDLGGRTATDILLESLGGGEQSAQSLAGPGVSVQAATHGETSIEVDDVTGTVMISLAGEKYHGAISSVRIVSDSVPEGISFIRDGRALLVRDGTAFELAPVPAGLVEFVASVEEQGFGFDMSDKGAISLDLGGGQRFSGVVAYDNLHGTEGACENVTFAEPTGAPDSSGYSFTVRCENGAEQRMVPFIHDPAFYSAVAAVGLRARTDRNSGIITIPGAGRYKPGFYVDELTDEEEAYRAENAGERGVAFRFTDLDDDGVEDVIVLTESGAQPVYWVGP